MTDEQKKSLRVNGPEFLRRLIVESKKRDRLAEAIRLARKAETRKTESRREKK